MGTHVEPLLGARYREEEHMTVAEVDAVARAFHDGVAKRDPEALARLFAPHGRLLAPNMQPCIGRTAIYAGLQQLLDMGVRSVEVEPMEVREAGDMTIEYGRYTLNIEPDGAEATVDLGKYVIVHETQDDVTTKIALSIFNSNLPADA
jgi:uncharacterized protein (TIGR02246 family)